MSEILSAIRLKDKLTIAGVMAAVAVILATVVGLLTYFTADRHTHVYDYTLQMEEDGSFTLVGLCNVENCEKPHYHQANLDGVKIISATSPTCVKEGNRVYTYTVNGVTIKYTETLPVAEHTYTYDLVPNPGTDNVHINGKCEVDGCTNPYVFIYNVKDLTLIETIEATCFSPRKEIYAYVSNGETHTFTTLVGETTSHTLNGMLASKFQNKDGSFTYGTPGIKLFSTTVPGCGETTQGYYQCELCKSVVGVNVNQPAHKFVYNESNLVLPTFETSGLATLKCSNGECQAYDEVVIPRITEGVNTVQKSPATELHLEVVTYTYTSLEYGFVVEFDIEVGELLEHAYEYTLEPNKLEPSKMDLICHCHQPECQTPEVRVENVETTKVNTSTCTKLGTITWTYTFADGNTVELTVVSPVYAAHVYTYDKKDIVKPSFDADGSVKLTCTNPECDHTADIVLPKAVVGENVSVDIETDEYIVYKYEYVTDKNLIITTNIYVDK